VENSRSTDHKGAHARRRSKNVEERGGERVYGVGEFTNRQSRCLLGGGGCEHGWSKKERTLETGIQLEYVEPGPEREGHGLGGDYNGGVKPLLDK